MVDTHRGAIPNNTQPPSRAHDEGEITVSSGQPIPQCIADELRRTRGWTQCASVLLFVAAGILGLGIVGFFAVVAVAAGRATDIDSETAYGVSALIGLTVCAASAAAGLLGLHLHRFSHSVRAAASHRIAVDLERALGHLRRFWRLAVVVVGIGVVLGVLGGVLGAGVLIVFLREV